MVWIAPDRFTKRFLVGPGHSSIWTEGSWRIGSIFSSPREVWEIVLIGEVGIVGGCAIGVLLVAGALGGVSWTGICLNFLL